MIVETLILATSKLLTPLTDSSEASISTNLTPLASNNDTEILI